MPKKQTALHDRAMRLVTYPLVPVYSVIFKRQLTLATKIHELVPSITDLRLRSEFDLPLPGHDEQIDAQLGEAIVSFFDWKLTAQGSQPPQGTYENWLNEDSVATEHRSMLFRTAHWLNFKVDQEAAERISLAHKKLHDSEIDSPVPVNVNPFIWETHQELRKIYRREKRGLRKSKLPKYDFSLKQINPSLPWFSIVFLLAGYVHLSILYSHFGIEVNQYFLLGDYVSSSVDQIESAIVGLIGVGIVVLRRFRSSKAHFKHEQAALRRADKRIISLLFGLSVSFIVVCFDSRYFPDVSFLAYPDLAMISVMFSGATVISLASKRYFNDPVKVSIFGVAVYLFFTSLLFNTYSRIDAIKSNKEPDRFSVEVEGGEFTDRDYRIIGSNARFVFLFSRDGATIIVPIAKIGSFVVESHAP